MSGAQRAESEAGRSGLVGREAEFDRARRAVAAGRHCVLSGPAGIGKSTLQQAVVESLPERGWTPVLHGLESLSSVPLGGLQPLLVGREARGRSDEELAAEMAELVGDRVLLVDDVQWFDTESCRVLDLLTASHASLVAGRTPLSDYVGRIPALMAATEHVEIEPLSAIDAATLARLRRPGASSGDIDRIVGHGGGVPLFIEFSAAAETPAPHPINAAVGGLRPELHGSLAILAAAENPVPAEWVSAHEHLVAVGLAVRTDGGEVRVAHACVSEAAREVLPLDVFSRAHRRLASLHDDPVRQAIHLRQAGDHDDARRVALGAIEGDLTRIERAALLAVVATAGPREDPRLLVDAAEALVDAGRCDRGVELARSAGPSDDPGIERRRRTALARGTWSNEEPDKEATLAALEMTDPDRHPMATVQLRSILARITGRNEWDPEGAIAHARAGLEVSERHDLPASEAHSAMATAYLVSGDPRWKEHLHTAIQLARDTGDARGEFMALDTLFIGEMVVGDMERCTKLAEMSLRRAVEVDVPFAVDRFRVNDLLARMVLADDPIGTAAEARDALRRPMVRRAREFTVVISAIVSADCGHDAEAREALLFAPMIGDDNPTAGALRAMAAAEAHLSAGRARAAMEAAAECLASPVAGFPAHQLVAPVRSWAAHDLGLEPLPPVASGYPNVERFLAEARAVDALTDDPDGAVRRFEEAIGAWGQTRSRFSLRCELGRYEALLATGEHREIEGLRELVGRCDDGGFVVLARRGRRLLRRHGAPSVRRRASSSHVVTGAQEEMLDLVLEGLTTREIGARLFVAPSTVDSSIAAAQRALGATSRLAAAVAVRVAAATPGGRGLRYTDDRRALDVAIADLSRERVVMGLDEAPTSPWELSSSIVWTTEVRDEETAAEAIRGLLRGGSLLVFVDSAAQGADRFLADAQRLADVEEIAPLDRPELTDEQTTILALVRSGATTAKIAEEIHVSRRTAERRLAALRTIFGVETNAELARR